MPDRDQVDRLHARAKLLAQEFVAMVARSDEGNEICETVLLSAMTIGLLLGSNAETMRQTTNMEGLKQWLTVTLATAANMLDNDRILIRFEVIEKDASPSS